MARKTINLKQLSIIGLACALAACGGGGEDAHSDQAQAADAQQAQNVTVGLSTQATNAAAEPTVNAQAAAPGTLTVRAKGSLAKNGGPVMKLLVNGVSRGSIEVRSLVYTDYNFSVGTVPAGAKIEVVFNNDYYLNGEDRNLFVESISVNGATIASTAPSVRFDRGSNAAAFDNVDVLAGLSSLWWNGALRFNAPAAPVPSSKATLAIEAGANATNPSIKLSGDRLSVSFGDQVNPACAARTGIYAAPDFGGTACHKRAVRASAGIKQGEFRYYEGHRLFAPSNLGFGYTTANSAIDPYCCLVEGGAISQFTPPSMSVNAFGGIYYALRFSSGFFTEQTSYYGFAVDYTGTDPVVYVVTRDYANAMQVTRLPTPGFNGLDAVPFVYSHFNPGPTPDTPVASVNFGQQAYHYDLAALRSELAIQGANVSKFVPGVGAP